MPPMLVVAAIVAAVGLAVGIGLVAYGIAVCGECGEEAGG
jgi:hypothetical protein